VEEKETEPTISRIVEVKTSTPLSQFTCVLIMPLKAKDIASSPQAALKPIVEDEDDSK
jgi:hypothetical protein